MAAAGAAMVLPAMGCSRTHSDGKNTQETIFRFCLNTSTIQGCEPDFLKRIEVAARAGYDGVELWVRDIQAYLQEGHSLVSLDKYIRDSGLTVDNAIGFAPWLVDDEATAQAGFRQMREEMEMMAAIGCTRIAAPAAGSFLNTELDLFAAGARYRELIDLGRQTGVMPHLEFWGASKVLYHIGQTLMIMAVAGDPDVRLLPDIYHMFRGGSEFETLNMIDGRLIELFHVNDYPGDMARQDQTDADRVFPGDGAAPVQMIFDTLAGMGGQKTLSLELFNRTYWQRDALAVAEEGLLKMKQFV